MYTFKGPVLGHYSLEVLSRTERTSLQDINAFWKRRRGDDCNVIQLLTNHCRILKRQFQDGVTESFRLGPELAQ